MSYDIASPVLFCRHVPEIWNRTLSENFRKSHILKQRSIFCLFFTNFQNQFLLLITCSNIRNVESCMDFTFKRSNSNFFEDYVTLGSCKQ